MSSNERTNSRITVAVFSNKKLLPAFQLLEKLQPVNINFSDWSFRPAILWRNIKYIKQSDITYLHSPSNLRILLLPIAKLFRKKTMTQWIGGDVLLATHQFREDFYDVGDDRHVDVKTYTLNGLKGLEYLLVWLTFVFSQFYVRFLKMFANHHVACARHLSEDLEKAGITAQYLPIINPVVPELLPLPAQLSVLTYLGYFSSSDTGDYYGWKTIINLAKDNPDLKILVIGRGLAIEQVPANIELLGFVKDIKEVLTRVRGVLRISYYDGTPRLIVEGLATGRYIAYTRNFSCCSWIKNYQDGQQFIDELRHQKQHNIAGFHHIQEYYDPERVCSLYMKELKSCLDLS